jgi:gag-polypeptide of LTR copia-type
MDQTRSADSYLAVQFSLTFHSCTGCYCSTSSQLWKYLTQLYNSQSLAKILEFKLKLQKIKKDNDTCAQYLQKIQSIADRLNSIGAPVSDQDLILYTLQGLGSEFESFVTALSLRQGSFSSIELHNLLLAHEARIQANLQHVNLTSHSGPTSSGMMSDSPSTQALAMQHSNRGNTCQGQSSGNSYRKNNFRGRGRGRHSNFSKEQVQCQICYKWGHTTLKCYHRFDVSYTRTPSPAQSTPQQALLAEPSSSVVLSSTWFLDSSASTHVTPDINNLSSSQPYLGVDKVHMGNGSGLSISHTGTASIPYSYGNLHLRNVLCVPHLTKNLLSIAQLLKDNSVSVEFTFNSCFVKDLTTQRVLLHGSLCYGLYALDIPSPPVQVYHTTHSSSDHMA